MRRPSLFVCISLFATAAALAAPGLGAKSAGAVGSEQQRGQQLWPEQFRRACRGPQQFHRRTSQIEDRGCRLPDVTALKKDDKGVWRGKASKGGSATAVSVDFQGNVNSTK